MTAGRRSGLWALSLLTAAAGAAALVSATWSHPGANGKIAFATNRGSGGDVEIFAMNGDGSGQTNLTNDAGSDSAPAWSPDGTKIAFQTARLGNAEVYVMNADGSGQTNLTKNAGEDRSPTWSPDGTKIAFETARLGVNEVYVMNADGSGQTNLTNDADDADSEPAWSPDGTKIAFTKAGTASAEVYVMNPDGSGQANLTNDAGIDSQPAWSPDGTRIAFQTNRTGDPEVFVMAAAGGSGPTNLTNAAGPDSQPAWSPDGTKIAFSTERTGNLEVYVMNADGSGQSNLSDSGAADREPDWQALPRTAPGASPSPGPGPAPSARLADVTKPRLSRVSLTNTAFRVGAGRRAAPRGTTFRFLLSEPARVTITIQRATDGRRVRGACRALTRSNRNGRPCVRYARVGELAQRARAGANATAFSGRLRGRALAPGVYRALLAARDAAGNRSASVAVAFRVVPA